MYRALFPVSIFKRFFSYGEKYESQDDTTMAMPYCQLTDNIGNSK
jgi:hypothetical protein